MGTHRALHSFPTRRSSDLCPAPSDHCNLCESFLRSLRYFRRASFNETPPMKNALAARPIAYVPAPATIDRKSTRLNSSHVEISYAVFCLKKKMNEAPPPLV